MDKRFVQLGLKGRPSHVSTLAIFEGLEWKRAGEKPAGIPHSVWELLYHMIFWQDYMLTELQGKKPERPERAAESWPAEPAPPDEGAWNEAVRRFTEGLNKAMQEAENDLTATVYEGRIRMDLLMGIATHNSYHAGQVVLVRRAIGEWPPPSGGDTW